MFTILIYEQNIKLGRSGDESDTESASFEAQLSKTHVTDLGSNQQDQMVENKCSLSKYNGAPSSRKRSQDEWMNLIPIHIK